MSVARSAGAMRWTTGSKNRVFLTKLNGGRMQVDLVDPKGTLLREIADKRMKRDDVALSYAFALRQPQDMTQEDFAEVNHAIMDRWSIAALRYIKDKAWRLARG